MISGGIISVIAIAPASLSERLLFLTKSLQDFSASSAGLLRALVDALVTSLPISTMAEVLGIVTGSIALLEVAGRLGGRVLKLKQLFDELKEVPDTIRSLMEQVAVVEPIRLKSSKWKKKTRSSTKKASCFYRGLVLASQHKGGQARRRRLCGPFHMHCQCWESIR